MTRHVVTQSEAIGRMGACKPFRASALSATLHDPRDFVSRGYLPREAYARLIALQEHSAVYVVWSYATPIAWVPFGEGCDGQAELPPYRYSRTTSKHQSYARRGLSAFLRIPTAA